MHSLFFERLKLVLFTGLLLITLGTCSNLGNYITDIDKPEPNPVSTTTTTTSTTPVKPEPTTVTIDNVVPDVVDPQEARPINFVSITTLPFDGTGNSGGTGSVHEGYITLGEHLIIDATQKNLQTTISIPKVFDISTTEISQSFFEEVMGYNPSVVQGPNLPVTNVSWWEAIVFCNKYSVRQGFDPVYFVNPPPLNNIPQPPRAADYALVTNADPHNNSTFYSGWETRINSNRARDGYRLPTDGEWVWAAVDAQVKNPPQNYQFAGYFNEDTPTLTDYAVTGSKILNIASKYPNLLGIYDLSGNVAEWVWDGYAVFVDGFFKDYVKDPVEINNNNSTALDRVVRGGSFSDVDFSITNRQFFAPSFTSSSLGFRIVRRPQQIP